MWSPRERIDPGLGCPYVREIREVSNVLGYFDTMTEWFIGDRAEHVLMDGSAIPLQEARGGRCGRGDKQTHCS